MFELCLHLLLLLPLDKTNSYIVQDVTKRLETWTPKGVEDDLKESFDAAEVDLTGLGQGAATPDCTAGQEAEVEAPEHGQGDGTDQRYYPVGPELRAVEHLRTER